MTSTDRDLRVTYLSMDPLGSTVGASQVLAYVLRLASRGVGVDLHSFERTLDGDLRDLLTAAGVRWHPHRFGAGGARGGLGRVARLAQHIRGASLVHARSDMAAAAVMSSSVGKWVWDVRSLWADQKVATGVFSEGSLQARVFRRIERAAARRSDRVITLTSSAIDVLDDRHGGVVGPKADVVTTCADRQRFVPAPPPENGPLRVLLAGTLNRYYDVPAMLDLVAALRRMTDVEFIVAAPETTDWESDLEAVGAVRLSASAAEMPDLIASCHVGLSICREDAGVSLLAAMPTKIGEILAVGRPVVVNRGLVDATHLLEDAEAGMSMTPDDDLGLVAARVLSLVDDPETAGRATALAARNFDLDGAVDQLVRIYRGLECLK